MLISALISNVNKNNAEACVFDVSNMRLHKVLRTFDLNEADTQLRIFEASKRDTNTCILAVKKGNTELRISDVTKWR